MNIVIFYILSQPIVFTNSIVVRALVYESDLGPKSFNFLSFLLRRFSFFSSFFTLIIPLIRSSFSSSSCISSSFVLVQVPVLVHVPSKTLQS